MANHNDLIVWVDCEMTGLSLTKDALIEIAVVVTDSHLNEMDPGIDIVIKCEDEKLDTMIDVVKECTLLQDYLEKFLMEYQWQKPIKKLCNM